MWPCALGKWALGKGNRWHRPEPALAPTSSGVSAGARVISGAVGRRAPDGRATLGRWQADWVPPLAVLPGKGG